jgi:hypothetical protein
MFERDNKKGWKMANGLALYLDEKKTHHHSLDQTSQNHPKEKTEKWLKKRP